MNYHEEPLEFNLVFGTDEPLDRFDLQEIQLWLTGYQDYQWLSFDQPDMEPYMFRCLVTELKPLTVGWVPHAFEATITCDCPYAYGHTFREEYAISGSKDVVFRNFSSVREYLRPELKITVNSGSTDFSIVNEDDNSREFKFTGLPAAGCEITINNEGGIITEKGGANLYDKFNMNFFRLVRGANHLKITGNATLTISGRMLYNVGA